MWDNVLYEVKTHARLTVIITGVLTIAGMIMQLPSQPELSLVMLAMVIVLAMVYRQASLIVMDLSQWWKRRHAR
jgi:hypothetical protein